MDWNIPICNGCLNQSKFLTSTLLQNGLTQLVHSPTHGSNYLHLVFVSVPHLITTLSMVDPFSSSCDHSSVEYFITWQHYFPKDYLMVQNFSELIMTPYILPRFC